MSNNTLENKFKYMGTKAIIKLASKGCMEADEALFVSGILKDRIPECKMYFGILVTKNNKVVEGRISF